MEYALALPDTLLFVEAWSRLRSSFADLLKLRCTWKVMRQEEDWGSLIKNFYKFEQCKHRFRFASRQTCIHVTNPSSSVIPLFTKNPNFENETYRFPSTQEYRNIKLQEEADQSQPEKQTGKSFDSESLNPILSEKRVDEQVGDRTVAMKVNILRRWYRAL